MASTLKAFAETEPTRACRVCALPEQVRAQIDEGKGTVPSTVIEKWLKKEQDLRVSEASIRRHWKRHL